MLQPGDEFEGRYRVVRELGRGAFAVVYLAEHLEFGGQLALKVLKEGRSDERFVREAKLLAELRSPHTVTLHDFGRTAERRPYMSFEYVEGETLEDRLARIGPMPAGRTAHIIRQVLSSLAEAHERGIVHRDVKPANIMLTRMGRDEDFVKVLDFGVAKPLSDVREVSQELTIAGQLIGTMRYMAPEQLRDERKAVPASDVYAAGLIAYEMLTNEKAAAGEDAHVVLARHLDDEPYTIPYEVDVPIPFRNCFESMMQKPLEFRPVNARAALRLLDSIDDDIATTVEISAANLPESVRSPRARRPAPGPDRQNAPRPPGNANRGSHSGSEERLEIDESALRNARSKPQYNPRANTGQRRPTTGRRRVIDGSRHDDRLGIGGVLMMVAVAVIVFGVVVFLFTKFN
jgi:serine/threonine protein kinase